MQLELLEIINESLLTFIHERIDPFSKQYKEK